MRVVGFGRLAVEQAAADAAAAGRADRERRGPLAAAAISQFGQLVGDLVERRVHVVGELNLGDGTQAVEAHADRGRDDAALGERRVEHAPRTEPLLQALRRAEHAAEVAHVLAHHADVRIALEHHLESGPNRLYEVHRGHGARVQGVSVQRSFAPAATPDLVVVALSHGSLVWFRRRVRWSADVLVPPIRLAVLRIVAAGGRAYVT